MDLDKLFGSMGDGNMPSGEEVFDEGAKAIYRFFMSFVNAGFTRNEALTLVIELLQRTFFGNTNDAE